jgi:hypothetical protein
MAIRRPFDDLLKSPIPLLDDSAIIVSDERTPGSDGGL